jgi:hypothetical protein
MGTFINALSATEKQPPATDPPLQKSVKPFQPEINDTHQAAIQDLLATASHPNEERYAKAVHQQVIRDLATLYNSPQTEITLASFTDDHTPGQDRGFGLHEVRMLNVGDKTILANIHWPFRPEIKGFTFPDEIRVRTRVFSGDRGQAESEAQYITARYRIAWDEMDRPSLFLEPQWDTQNRRMQRRVPISVFSCTNCHTPGPMHQLLAERFADPQTPLNPEFIVQPSYFQRPLEHTDGYRQVQAYLKRNHETLKLSAADQEGILTALTKKENLDLPGLAQKLAEMQNRTEYNVLSGPDTPLDPKDISRAQGYPGIYAGRNSHYFMDSLEAFLFDQGKINYDRPVWWSDARVIPPRPPK